jgi:iron complex transport system substrate-binding protein
MRVLSLLPAATEIVAALGAGHSLVGISHECDYPPSVTHLPRVTQAAIDPKLPGAVIDAEVRRLMAAGTAVITVDAVLVRSLAPDLIVTQDLCEVCAVDGSQVLHLAPAVVRLAGRSLAGAQDDIRTVGRALDLVDEAGELITGMQYRLGRLAVTAPARPPRVACIEWLEPLYLAGHWVPELVQAAGGVAVGGEPGEKSRRRAWAEVVAMRPDLILVMLCGFSVERGRQEWGAFARANPGVIALLGATPVRFVDGNALTSRPGPRLVEGAAAIQAAFRG